MLTKDNAGNPFSIEAQLNTYALLANTTLQRVSELVELNLALGRDAVRESADARKRLLAAADASQYTALSALLARESLEHGLGYARDFVRIVTKTYLPDPQPGAVAGARTASKAA
jgi:phasin family protein